MPIDTPSDYWRSMQKERTDAFTPQSSDGPILKRLKGFFGWGRFHSGIEFYTLRHLVKIGVIHDSRGAESSKDEFNKAVEHYWVLWTIGLLVTYILSWVACHLASCDSVWPWVRFLSRKALYLLAVVAIFRVLEILAVSFRLHLLLPYQTRSPAHAMILTFLAYLHVLIAFSVLYLAESCWLGDPFKSSPGLWVNPVDALYFSTVTITTVGYGDLSPERWLGKLLVILEIFVGLILVVVAFQTVLGGFDFPDKEERKGRSTQGSSDSAAQADS